MTSFQYVVFGSDVLFALLLAGLGAGIAYALRKEHLRRAWRTVFSGRMAMASLAILLVYLSIAILDSFHYRPALQQKGDAPAAKVQYSVEVHTLLDALLSGLRDSREKSYSAPLATHLYEKQMVEQPDGSQKRERARLKFGGAHLTQAPAGWAGDVAARTAKGAVLGAALWLALTCVLALGVARAGKTTAAQALRAIFGGRTFIAWDGFVWALLLVLLAAGVLATLSGGYHVFGTDATGNDVLYQALKAIRVAILIGTLATLVVLPFGIGLGLAAGYFGGRIDDAIQYIYTVISSIPYVLLIAAAALMMQMVIQQHADIFDTAAARADARLMSLCLIIGAISWTTLCRLLRAETLKLRELDYVQAARCFGVSSVRIMLRHILPNAFHIVLITVVLDFSALVLAEAVLSYVGVGVDPTTISFGNMINTARGELARDPVIWWSITAAFVFMVMLVLSANLFADAVREAFDPRGVTSLKRRLRMGAAR